MPLACLKQIANARAAHFRCSGAGVLVVLVNMGIARIRFHGLRSAIDRQAEDSRQPWSRVNQESTQKSSCSSQVSPLYSEIPTKLSTVVLNFLQFWP